MYKTVSFPMLPCGEVKSYECTVVDGVIGCIYHNGHEFRAKLTHLIEDAAYRHAMAAAAYAYVQEHRLLAQHYGD